MTLPQIDALRASNAIGGTGAADMGQITMAIQVHDVLQLGSGEELDYDMRAADGRVLFEHGKQLCPEDLATLKACGISNVFQIDEDAEVETLQRKYNLLRLSPKAAPSGFRLARSAVSQDGDMVSFPIGTVCDDQTLEEMIARGVEEITIDLESTMQPKTKNFLDSMRKNGVELDQKVQAELDREASVHDFKINAEFVDMVLTAWQETTTRFTGLNFQRDERSLDRKICFSDHGWLIRWKGASQTVAALTLTNSDAEVIAAFTLNLDPSDVNQPLVVAFFQKLLTQTLEELTKTAATSNARVEFEPPSLLIDEAKRQIPNVTHSLTCPLRCRAGTVSFIFGFDAEIS